MNLSYLRLDLISLILLKDTGVEYILSRMLHHDKCIVKKGYFSVFLDGIKESFCLVSLDCDFYDPIFEGIKYFYPRLFEGGFIIMHNYNEYNFGNGVKKAVDDYRKIEKIVAVPLCDFSGSVIIQKRCKVMRKLRITCVGDEWRLN